MIHKLAVFILVLSITYLLREILIFVNCLKNDEGYKCGTAKLLGTGLSLSYIITLVITGLP
jgi:hypothetical protein